MKAKLLTEQMGVPAGTVMEVLNDGGTRARVCIAPNGLRVAIAAEYLEMVPVEEPVEETSGVESAEPETYDFSQDPEPTEDEEPLEPHFSTAPSDLDNDLDEELPEPQQTCDGESCESCQ